MFLSETYYLTMAGPGRGERVVAKIDTSDPAGAEKLLGCGFTDEKGFGFRGLYREEEVRHMFPPGTEIPGTRDGRTGVAEHYRDYRKSPQFLYQGGKLYRVRDGGASLLDIPDTWNFDKVRMAMAGKGAAAHLPDVREDFPARKDVPGHVWKDAAPAPTEAPKAATGPAAKAAPAPTEAPKAATGPAAKAAPAEQGAGAYKLLNVPHAVPGHPDSEFDPVFDAPFYHADRQAREEMAAQGIIPGMMGQKPSGKGDALRQQGQPLKDLFPGGIGAGEFHME